MPLTDRASATRSPTAKPYNLSMAGGLYIEVAPSGGKWWRFKYRFAGKEKRLSLGVFPDVPLATARKRRDEARELLADGIDPGAQAQGRQARSRGPGRQQFRGRRARVVRQAIGYLGGHARQRRAAAAGRQPVPGDRRQAHCRARSPRPAGGRPEDRATRRARPGASRAAGGRASAALWHRDRPLQARPIRRSEGRARPAQGQASSRSHGRGIAGAAARH